jgi:hypothetical protein
MAQMRRIFYCRINLAILLIGRHVATMLPQAAHRRATLAARCAQPPLDVIKRRDGRSQSCPARRAAANASAIGNPIANWNSVNLNSHRCNRGGSSALRESSEPDYDDGDGVRTRPE